jgi:hypothetical protein
MADFSAVTASNGARVHDAAPARAVLRKFRLTMEGSEFGVGADGRLVLHGYDWFEVVAVPEPLPADLVAEHRDLRGCEPVDWRDLWDDASELEAWQRQHGLPAGIDALAASIAPHLVEPWVIQSVGAQKCRFPLSAMQWTIQPNGEVRSHSLSGEDCASTCSPEGTVTLDRADVERVLASCDKLASLADHVDCPGNSEYGPCPEERHRESYHRCDDGAVEHVRRQMRGAATDCESSDSAVV